MLDFECWMLQPFVVWQNLLPTLYAKNIHIIIELYLYIYVLETCIFGTYSVHVMVRRASHIHVLFMELWIYICVLWKIVYTYIYIIGDTYKY